MHIFFSFFFSYLLIFQGTKVDAKDSDSGHINAFMAREVMGIDVISQREVRTKEKWPEIKPLELFKFKEEWESLQEVIKISNTRL